MYCRKGGFYMRTYDAPSIAAYVINEYNNAGEKINNLKLQKIMYYIQARYLVDHGIPAFNNEIGKWKLGPVVEDLYHLYKNNKANDIIQPENRVNVRFNPDGIISIETVEDMVLEDDDREVIDGIIRATIGIDKFDLVDRTHRHTPWREQEENINAGVRMLK